MMQIHFYTFRPGPDTLASMNAHTPLFASWEDTSHAISMCADVIHTTQMGLLSTSLLVKDYRVFIHDDRFEPQTSYEIKLGCDNERTNREIKVSHNLFKMWACGEFGGLG